MAVAVRDGGGPRNRRATAGYAQAPPVLGVPIRPIPRWSTMNVPSFVARVAAPCAVALALCAAAAIPTAASAASAKTCKDIIGEGSSPFQITARGTSCTVARRLAGRVSKVREAPFKGCTYISGRKLRITSPCVRSGYRCRTVSRSGDTIRISCNRGSRNVRFRM